MTGSDGVDEDRPLLVCFSLFVPYEGIPHAGGEYVLRHLRVLSRDFQIVLVAPGNVKENRKADVSGLPWTTRVVTADSLLARRAASPLWAIHRAIRGATYRIDILRAIKRDASLRKLVSGATVVEFQWLETAVLARWVSSSSPALRSVIVHDVLTQRWGREAERATSVGRRIFFSLRRYSSAAAQRRALSATDVAITFSDKDALLLGERSGSSGARIEVVHPPLEEESVAYIRTPDENRHNVLFTAALSRPENDEGAQWLLREVWLRVLETCPNARLTIAGSGPSSLLRQMADADDTVTLTGYVESLDPFYRDADVFVAPLHTGAGVKFKTATAMLWGLPVVSTPIGAEGIGGVADYVAVTDDPHSFAVAIIDALQDRVATRKVADRGRAWARQHYGHDEFKSSLGRLYRSERSIQ